MNFVSFELIAIDRFLRRSQVSHIAKAAAVPICIGECIGKRPTEIYSYIWN